MGKLFTSESVTSGHPDKLCDFISDSILDECLKLDKNAKVAVEVFVKGLDNKVNGAQSHIIIGGEVSLHTNYRVDYEKIARSCASIIGYSDIDVGMDANDKDNCKVHVLISGQSEEINQGVSSTKSHNLEQGAGDQGIVFGYASDESEKYEITKGSYMPLAILLSHKLTTSMTKKRISGELDWARPDGKSQVTIAYDDENRPIHVDTIVIAIQHEDMIASKMFKNEEDELKYIRKEIIEKIILEEIPKDLLNDGLKVIVNGTGRFCKGGPHADAGLTGRKIIVDSYGGYGRHGGGAFSGKDPSKVDRSGAYMARWAAKHVIASGIAKECEIQIAYSIGKSEPVSINVRVDTFGTSKIPETGIANKIKEIFDFSPHNIVNELELLNPIFAITSSGGHFGRKSEDGNFNWEKINLEKINILKSII